VSILFGEHGTNCGQRGFHRRAGGAGKVERGPAALDRFKNIVFQTIFKESKNESPL